MLMLLAALTARADMPPPKGYVETCTVEANQSATRECTTCAGYHGGREPCEALEKDRYTKVCQTRGASVWSEVMCRDRSDAPADPKPEPPAVPAPPTPTPAPAAPAPVAPASGGCTTVPLIDVPPQKDGCKCDSSAPGGIFPLLAVLALVASRRG